MGSEREPFTLRACGTRGLQTSHLGLGGAPLGRPADREGVEPAEADESGARTLEIAYELGIRHVDTSPLYGESERRIGIALRRDAFAGLTISTKVGTHPKRKFQYAADDIRWSLENSLSLFGRDAVDLALVHDPPSMDLILAPGDGLEALARLRDEGLCRNVGLGVHSHSFHRQAIGAGLVDVILTYGDYNIVRRNGVELMQFAHDNGVGVLLGSPMMHGLLAVDEEPRVSLERRPALLSWYEKEDIDLAQGWWEWCRDRDISMRHLNMQFVMGTELADCVLTGGANVAEIRTNVHEASTPIPEPIWTEAMQRIEQLDAVSAAANRK